LKHRAGDRVPGLTRLSRRLPVDDPDALAHRNDPTIKVDTRRNRPIYSR
jgi:hypothetical protein